MLHGYDVSTLISSSSALDWTERWLWFLFMEVSVWSTQACLDSVGGTRGGEPTPPAACFPQSLIAADGLGGRDPNGRGEDRTGEERTRLGGDGFPLAQFSPNPISGALSLVSPCQRAGLRKPSGSRLIRRPWRGSRLRRWRCSTWTGGTPHRGWPRRTSCGEP